MSWIFDSCGDSGAQCPGIDAISVPAIAMLQQILNALPAIFTAALI